MLNELRRRQHAPSGSNQADDTSVHLSLSWPGDVGAEDERKHLLDEGDLGLPPGGAIPPFPSVAVVGTSPPPPGTPEEVPDPEVREPTDPPPPQADSPPPSSASALRLACHDGSQQEGHEDHEVDHQHEDGPHLERFFEDRPTPPGKPGEEWLGISLDEPGVEAVDQGSSFTYLQVAPPGLQEGSEGGLDLMAGKACGRDGVTQGYAAPGLSERTEDWPGGASGLGDRCDLSIHSEELPSHRS